MRTTLILDEDVSTLLKKEVRRTGEPFKQAVNRYLRAGLSCQTQDKKPFKVKPRKLGSLPAGLSYDNIEGLLDSTEGPAHR